MMAKCDGDSVPGSSNEGIIEESFVLCFIYYGNYYVSCSVNAMNMKVR